MEWVSDPCAARPSLGRARRLAEHPAEAGPTKLTGGKFGENFPSLIKRLGTREK